MAISEKRKLKDGEKELLKMARHETERYPVKVATVSNQNHPTVAAQGQELSLFVTEISRGKYDTELKYKVISRDNSGKKTINHVSLPSDLCPVLANKKGPGKGLDVNEIKIVLQDFGKYNQRAYNYDQRTALAKVFGAVVLSALATWGGIKGYDKLTAEPEPSNGEPVEQVEEAPASAPAPATP
jgi:hypothetical protein